MFNFMLKNRKIVTILLVLSGIILTGLLFIFTPDCTNGIVMPWIEKLYYCVQIVAGLYVVVGAVIAVWQYYISSKSEFIKNETEKVNKAVELAGFYKDNVIPRISYVRYIYENIHATEIINKIDKSEMVYFDSDELHKQLSQEDINKLKSLTESDEFVEAVREANIIFNSTDILNIECNSSRENMINAISLNLMIAQNCMLGQIRDLLNNLEYFAMFFTHNIADESVVFQSLHQSYLEIIETMYYQISLYNVSDNHKFYVNATKLYDLWTKKDVENQKKMKDVEKEMKKNKEPSLGTVSKNFIDA